MKRKRTMAQNVARIVLILVLGTAIVLSGLAFSLYLWASGDIDSQADKALFSSLGASKTTRIYVDAHKDNYSQNRLSYIPIEYAQVWSGENAIWVTSQEIPNFLKLAFVSVEDHRFYEHDGVDWLRTCKAAANYMLHFEKKFGGSTITQQLIKNVCGESDPTVKRKCKEIIRAYRLEKTYTKDEILTMYLNIVPLANHCTGVYAASKLYFGKEPEALTVAECASIAAITNAPSKYDPIKHPSQHLARRNLVLLTMYQNGYIDQTMYQYAKETPLTIMAKEMNGQPIHNWMTETVIADVIQDLKTTYKITHEAATRLVYRGGLQIWSTANPLIQNELETYFENYARLGKSLDGAMVILDAYTGNLLGVVGGMGKKEGNRLMNGATQVKRPPGSAIKPFSLYAPALEEGIANWASVYYDVPEVKKEGDTLTLWPKNSPDVYQGKIPLCDALAYSKNTVAVELLAELGVERSYAWLEKAGIEGLVREETAKDGKRITDLAPSPLALGQFSHGVTVRNLAEAYTALADGGHLHKSRSYVAVYDTHGHLLLENKPQSQELFTPQTAFITTRMLEGVTSYGTARNMTLKRQVHVAGKTGTTSGGADKWFAGYTPDYVAVVRYTSKDGGVDGYATPVVAWNDIMSNIYRLCPMPQKDDFIMPRGICWAPYCRDSGDMPTELCEIDVRGNRIAYGYFREDNIPKRPCESHIEVWDVNQAQDQRHSFYQNRMSLLGDEKNSVYNDVNILDQNAYLWYYKDNENEKSKFDTNPPIEKEPWYKLFFHRFLQ